ncbi:MAG: hypothetical protein KBG07_02185 [Elusimicrobia bacterium]|nr:hypothetical protein [Elusimicrobiota bacterium]
MIQFKWRSKKHFAGLFLALCGVAAGVGGYDLFKKPDASDNGEPIGASAGYSLRSDQETYGHDAMVELILRPAGDEAREALRKSTSPVTGWVERDGHPVVTVGELEKMRFAFNKETGDRRARWPVPWNALDGDYQLRLATASLPAQAEAIETGSFRVTSRTFESVPAGFGVLTLEGLGSLQRFVGPNGGAPHVGAMAEWAEFIGADAVLIQGAESSGHSKKLSSEFPWQMRPSEPVSALAKACHERGVKLGIYVLSYMVGGPAEFSPDYAYGWHHENGKPIHGLERPVRRGISIRDEKRPADIVKVLDRWSAVDGVDFLGLDYIRPVFGGNELVDDFVNDMPGVQKPQGYDQWSKEQRMSWIARGRYIAPTPALRNEPKFKTTDQWFWYRAHRTAGVVRKIVEGFGNKKPLWAFTLSWQKGWEHGQDPAMMRDAGIDMNGIMLYEADNAQYSGLLRQWNGYTRDAPFNLVVGNTFDWRLHQRTLNPSGPEEMVRRTLAAVDRFQNGRPVRGIFMHDLARGLRGVLGPYPPKEWFLAAGSAMTRVREIHGREPVRVSFTVPSEATPGAPLSGSVALSPGTGDGPVTVQLFSSSDVELSAAAFELTLEAPQADFTFRWKPNDRSPARGNRAFVAARSFRPSRPKEKCAIHMTYVQGHKSSPAVAELSTDANPAPSPDNKK